MSDNLQFVQDRIPNYHGYGDEGSRHDSDKRVRAILGESLTDAHVRFGKEFTPEQEKAFDEVVFHCMFGDQAFVRKIEHTKLNDADVEALIAGDRKLVELEEEVNAATTVTELCSLVDAISNLFAGRLSAIAG